MSLQSASTFSDTTLMQRSVRAASEVGSLVSVPVETRFFNIPLTIRIKTKVSKAANTLESLGTKGTHQKEAVGEPGGTKPQRNISELTITRRTNGLNLNTVDCLDDIILRGNTVAYLARKVKDMKPLLISGSVAPVDNMKWSLYYLYELPGGYGLTSLKVYFMAVSPFNFFCYF